MASDPNQLIALLAQMPGMVGRSVYEGQEQGLKRRQGEQAIQINDFALNAERQKQGQQEAYRADVDQYLLDPTPAGLMALASKYPQQAEALRKGWDVKDAAVKTADIRQWGSVYSSLKNGRTDLALGQLRARRDAEKAQGVDTALLDQTIAALEDPDPATRNQAIKALQGEALMNLAAADYDKFAQNYKVVGGEAEGPYTLGPGSRRYDADGNLVASAPFAPRPVSVGEGETIVEYDPNSTGGGDQASGGAGGDAVSRMVPITLQAESGNREYNRDGSRVTSPKGARGKMQVMPGTAKNPGFGLSPSDGTPEDDARLGREYLGVMMQRYNNDPAKAWAAYNAGPGAVDNAVKKGGDRWLQNMPAETRSYVNRNMVALRGQEQRGQPRVIAQGAPKPGKVQAQRLTPEEVASEGLDPNTVYYRGENGMPQAVSGQRADAKLKPVPTPIVNAVIENRNSIRAIDKALKALDAYPAGVGLISGGVPSWVSQRTDPKGVDVRAAIADIGSLRIHDRSGAAVTAAETPRLLPFIPLVTDTADTARKKLKRFREEYAAINRDIEGMYTEDQGYQPMLQAGQSPAAQRGAPQGGAPGSSAANPIVIRSRQEAMKNKGKWVRTPDGRVGKVR